MTHHGERSESITSFLKHSGRRCEDQGFVAKILRNAWQKDIGKDDVRE